jgi:RNA-directed DNA polymerase
MDDKRQKNQLELAFMEEDRGEAPKGLPEGTESSAGKRGTESPAIAEQLMEEVCGRENCKQALKRVKANKGSAGVDGMTVQQLPEYLKQHWPGIREQLLSGTYVPQPVKRVEIPKPDGGVRKLGIPTVRANCTRAQFAFGMGGDPPSVPSASRPALSGFEGAPNRRY